MGAADAHDARAGCSRLVSLVGEGVCCPLCGWDCMLDGLLELQHPIGARSKRDPWLLLCGSLRTRP